MEISEIKNSVKHVEKGFRQSNLSSINKMSTKIKEQNGIYNNDKKVNKTSRYEDNPDKLLEELNKVFKELNREFKYDIHEKTRRVMISVKDTETGDIIRQIPSEESLDFFAKTLEMVGLLVDQKG